MAHIDFNRDNHAHRLMLAEAIRAYKKRTGNTFAGSANGGEASLLFHLSQAGCATSEAQLDRILRAPHPDDRRATYPKIARQVALFLTKEGYFPPNHNPVEALEILPMLFDGFDSNAREFLDHVNGTYCSYQFSDLNSQIVITGTMTIGEVTEFNYAPVTEVVDIRHAKRQQLFYEGIAYSDRNANLFILCRERFLRHPRFYIFEESDRPDGHRIETLYGTLLGGARLRKRHLSPIALYRGDHPRPGRSVEAADMSHLPEYVRRYLSRAMCPGPQNAPLPREI
jgi:hypothetical protein